MSKGSCEAAESTEGATSRMAAELLLIFITDVRNSLIFTKKNDMLKRNKIESS